MLVKIRPFLKIMEINISEKCTYIEYMPGNAWQICNLDTSKYEYKVHFFNLSDAAQALCLVYLLLWGVWWGEKMLQ